jgi:hypothetical protein
MRSASPLEGKTTNRRAVCGRPASTVRRAGRATFPTPIVAARRTAWADPVPGLTDARVKPEDDDGEYDAGDRECEDDDGGRHTTPLCD